MSCRQADPKRPTARDQIDPDINQDIAHALVQLLAFQARVNEEEARLLKKKRRGRGPDDQSADSPEPTDGRPIGDPDRIGTPQTS